VTLAIFILFGAVFVPGLVLLVISILGRRNPQWTSIAAASTVGVCAALFVLSVLSHQLWGGLGLIVLAAAVAAGIVVGRRYTHWKGLRSLLTLAAAGSVVFPTSLVRTYVRDRTVPVTRNRLEVARPAPVVMVVFDCLNGISLMNEHRQIDAARYPNFARLASVSHWYRNASTVHPRTSSAVPALLTGRYPSGTAAPTEKNYPQNLFTLLKATGQYELTSFEPFTLLCPRDSLRDRVAPNVWTQWIGVTHAVLAVWLHDLKPWDLPLSTPTVPRFWFGVDHVLQVDPNQRRGVVRYSWDIGRAGQFRHFLTCLDRRTQPNFWFGHFALPHVPWNFLPSGRLHTPERGLSQSWGTEGPLYEIWANDDLLTRQAHQRHLLQQMYVDRLVGQLLDRLDETGLFEECLLVVVADHGVTFTRGQSGRLPTEHNLAEIMSVPLFIKYPGQTAGDVLDYNVELVDIAPTILQNLQLTPPEAVDGQSLISPDFRERPDKRFLNGDQALRVDAAFEARYPALIRMLDQFGSGEDPLRLFRIGPHPELVGQPAEALRAGPPSEFVIHPLNFQAEVENTPSSWLPVFLQAQVSGPERRPIAFAISVNDVIWGTTRTYQVEYLKDYWRVMLPESALPEGKSDIRVFEIVETADGRKLSECRIGPQGEGPILPQN